MNCAATEQPATAMTAEARDLLRREVRYRASYRGTLELDSVCRAMLVHLERLTDAELLAVRDLLLEGENNLMEWLVERTSSPPERHAMAADLLRRLFVARAVARKAD